MSLAAAAADAEAAAAGFGGGGLELLSRREADRYTSGFLSPFPPPNWIKTELDCRTSFDFGFDDEVGDDDDDGSLEAETSGDLAPSISAPTEAALC